MSKHEDNTDNKRLRELLDKSGKETPADDFEKEAMEGFAQLPDTEEAMKLKEELDAKMHSGVFAKRDHHFNRRAYWYMAAALLLIVGFTVYFIKTYYTISTENLALHNVKTELQLPESGLPAPARQEETEDPPMADSNANRASTAPARSLNLDEKNKTSAKKPSQAGMQEDLVAGENVKTVQSVPVSPFGASGNNSSSSENLPGAYAAAPALAKDNVGAADRLDDAPVDKALAEKEALSKSDREMKVRPAEEADVMQEVAAGKAKKRTSRLRSPESIRDASEEPAFSPDKPLPSCTYAGGESAFNARLKTMLLPAGLDKELKGFLLINRDGNVETAVLTKSGGLSKKNQKKVLDILKGIKGFTLDDKWPLQQFDFNYVP